MSKNSSDQNHSVTAPGVEGKQSEPNEADGKQIETDRASDEQPVSEQVAVIAQIESKTDTSGGELTEDSAIEAETSETSLEVEETDGATIKDKDPSESGRDDEQQSPTQGLFFICDICGSVISS